MILWRGKTSCIYLLYISFAVWKLNFVFILNEDRTVFTIYKGYRKIELGWKYTNTKGYMRYYKMMNGAFEVGSYFTFEAKHYYLSKLDHVSQRAVLFETVISEPTGKIIDLKTIKTLLDPADSNLH